MFSTFSEQSPENEQRVAELMLEDNCTYSNGQFVVFSTVTEQCEEDISTRRLRLRKQLVQYLNENEMIQGMINECLVKYSLDLPGRLHVCPRRPQARQAARARDPGG